MSPSELAHIFLDGGALESHVEVALFEALAASGELRAEMRDVLAIRAAVQNDVLAFAPPPETRRRLFAALAIVDAPSGVATGAPLGAAGWLRRLWIPLLAAIAASTITAVVMTRTHDASSTGDRTSQVPSPNSSNNTVAQQAPMPSVQTAPTIAAPAQHGRAIPSELLMAHGQRGRSGMHVSATKRVGERYHDVASVADPAPANVSPGNTSQESPDASVHDASIPPANTASHETSISLSSHPVEPVSTTRTVEPVSTSSGAIVHAPVMQDSQRIRVAEPPVQSHNNRTLITADSIAVAPPAHQAVDQPATPRIEPVTAPAMPPDALRRYALLVRGLATTSTPSSSVATSAGIGPTNLAVGVFRLFSVNHMVGIEAGQEAFGQEFSGRERDSAVNYQQNPMLFWGAAAYRASTGPLTALGGIAPFAQADLGATRIGPMARITLGIAYAIGDRIELLLGADNAYLWYRFQSAWFTSRKLGLTYGISMRF